MDAIDKTIFNDLRATAGAEFVTDLVNTFFEEAPAMLADLRSARAAADAERYRRVAHSLKSNGNTFGAKDFAAQARAIELGGLAADPARDIENIKALEAAYNQAAAALKKLTHG
jgi:histidine phosphotransfer protein HptB